MSRRFPYDGARAGLTRDDGSAWVRGTLRRWRGYVYWWCKWALEFDHGAGHKIVLEDMNSVVAIPRDKGIRHAKAGATWPRKVERRQDRAAVERVEARVGQHNEQRGGHCGADQPRLRPSQKEEK